MDERLQATAHRFGWRRLANGDWCDEVYIIRVAREADGWCRVLPDGGRQPCSSEEDALREALEPVIRALAEHEERLYRVRCHEQQIMMLVEAEEAEERRWSESTPRSDWLESDE